ncbi:50S ribosomal protein L10 [uncultured Porphyromonas sp.]|uniref:50S ribosomal protein L10 n=1 Tax=uncultured Porphyromonas sp. TaxID=159274 RepID=UPI00260B954F|nr:50S ribosomal protein L10 [uncultured Porphyromonas sp.]
MKKETKSTVIEQLHEYIERYPNFYLTNIEALNAEKTSELRRLCNKSGVKLVVVKNTLMRRALSEIDSVNFAELYESLKGNTAVMFSEVANAPAKAIKAFRSDNKELGRPDLKSAYVQEGFYIGADQLEALVNIKSREELIADIVAMLEGPIQGVLGQLDSAAGTIHGVLDTLAERQ